MEPVLWLNKLCINSHPLSKTLQIYISRTVFFIPYNMLKYHVLNYNKEIFTNKMSKIWYCSEQYALELSDQ